MIFLIKIHAILSIIGIITFVFRADSWVIIKDIYRISKMSFFHFIMTSIILYIALPIVLIDNILSIKK